jgi:transcriptional regulator with XRE-family HTH domain
MVRRYTSGSEFGTSVSQALAGANLTQTEFAASAGVSPSYVNQIVHGTKHPSPKWVDLVADILKLQAEQRGQLHYAAAKDAGYKLDLTKR